MEAGTTTQLITVGATLSGVVLRSLPTPTSNAAEHVTAASWSPCVSRLNTPNGYGTSG
jgi:hypothetical protein